MAKNEWWRVGGTLLALDAKTARRRHEERVRQNAESAPASLEVSSIHELPNFTTPSRLARKLGCAPITVLRDIRAGLLKATPHGVSYLIDPAHVEAYRLLKTEQARKRRRSA